MRNLLTSMEEYATEFSVPIVRPQTRQLLLETLAKEKPSEVLEIGTAIGYSTLLMLTSSDCRVTSIEKDCDIYQIACNNVAGATKIDSSISNRCNLILGDAKDVMDNFIYNRKKFDFIFLDGPKGQYVKYLPVLIQLLNVNGVIFADDVYYHGLVKKQGEVNKKQRTIVRNLRQYLEDINADNLQSQVYDIEDGVAITRKLK